MGQESVGDAGASSLGYYGGVFSPDGRRIAANGFTGALHMWQRPSAPSHGANRVENSMLSQCKITHHPKGCVQCTQTKAWCYFTVVESQQATHSICSFVLSL